jgi:hypothetical protein
LLIFAAYWLFSTRKIGKRPVKPVVIPTFKPPRNLSPAEVSYLRSRKYLGKSLTATFVDMAVRRSMTISCDEKKKYTLINKNDTSRLRPVEQQMHSTLFSGEKEIVEVIQENHKRFSQAEGRLKNFVTKQWNLNDYFVENRGQAKSGGVVFCIVLALYSLFTFSDGSVIMAFLFASPFITATALKVFTVSENKACCGVLLVTMLLSICLMIGALWLEFDDSFDVRTNRLSAGFYLTLSAGYFAYVSRLRMFTPEGAQIASELDGFRMYMKTAEEHRLNILTPPERTLELFEKLLPYAIF